MKYLRGIYEYLVLLISMAGFVPKHATAARAFGISASALLSVYLGSFRPADPPLAAAYFIVSEIMYIGFLFLVLPENGLRRWFMKKWGGEEGGYLAFEAAVGFLFFHNSSSLGYIALSTPGNFFDFIPQGALLGIAGCMILTGFAIKIWAAKAVSIDIYYWKDMFLGRKISEFVVSGPYKFLSNPMYGIGQLQAYGFALWHGSALGFMAALLNQALVFTFYFAAEKKFIQRVYGSNAGDNSRKIDP